MTAIPTPHTYPTAGPTQVGLPQVFNYTGTHVTYVVPSNCWSLHVKLSGAMGFKYDTYLGGYGGYIEAIIAVTPGVTLQVWVGRASYGATNDDYFYEGGFNGGGVGSPFYGRGGGGASDIRTNSSLSSRIIVAGGGGGAAYLGSGGAGGGLIGGSASTIIGYGHGGYGGSQTYGGGRSNIPTQSSAPYNASFGIGADSGNCGT